MATDLPDRLEAITGRRPNAIEALAGGCVGDVRRARFGGGAPDLVVKIDDSDEPRLDVEGRMLGDLASRSRLPVPDVIHAEPALLVMTYIAPEDAAPAPDDPADADEHAADLLAELHGAEPDAENAGRYGYDTDTLIGGLVQANPWTHSWAGFYREHRVLDMARRAHRAGRLGASGLAGVERLGERLEGLLARDGARPGLIHGDVWGGNVIGTRRRIAGFLDPAVYYADPEVELAFITLFGTFGDRFFARYAERRGVEAGFWEVRRELLVVYPLLVHVRLFGGGYAGQVERIVRRYAGR